MHPELRLLVELQSVDREIIELQEKIKAIPSKLKTAEQPLLEARAAYEKEKKKLDDFLKKKKDREFQLDEINEKIAREKARSSEIKTNKEYQAHMKSIETLEEEKSRIEDDLLVLMEEADEREKRLEEVGNVVKVEEGRIEDFRQILEKETGEVENELESLKEQRREIAEKLDRETYDTYMKKLEKSDGMAVVEVKDEVCQGCYMNIPPQLYVEVRKGEEILTCPQCRRFLYFLPEKKES